MTREIGEGQPIQAKGVEEGINGPGRRSDTGGRTFAVLNQHQMKRMKGAGKQEPIRTDFTERGIRGRSLSGRGEKKRGVSKRHRRIQPFSS